MYNRMVWALFVDKLMRNIDAVVLISDTGGKAVCANRQCADIIGVEPEDIPGSGWVSLMVPRHARGMVKDLFREIKDRKTLGRFDGPILAGDGTERSVKWTVIPLILGRRSLYMFVGKIAQRGEAVPDKGGRKYRTVYSDVVDTLFEASRRSEPQTAEHARRVMIYAERLAEKIKMPRKRIEKLKAASILHDLGKLAVDEKILFKKGRLSVDEFDEIRKHPYWGADVVRIVRCLHDIIPIMANHHENYDGTGYPMGLKGKKIPLEARVLSIADIYEALTADRPYRKGYSSEEAVAIIQNEKGHKLDPGLTEIFLEMLKKGEIRTERL